MLPYAAGSMTCGPDREFLEQPVGQISWAAAINRARLVLLAQCPLCPDSDQMLPRNEMTRCATTGSYLRVSAFAPNRTLGVAHRPTNLVRLGAKVGRELTIIPEALLREDPWQKGLDLPLDEMVLDLPD